MSRHKPRHPCPSVLLVIWSAWFLPSFWKGYIFPESQKISTFLISAIITQWPLRGDKRTAYTHARLGWNFCKLGTHMLPVFYCLTWPFKNPSESLWLANTANPSFSTWCITPNLNTYLKCTYICILHFGTSVPSKLVWDFPLLIQAWNLQVLVEWEWLRSNCKTSSTLYFKRSFFAFCHCSSFCLPPCLHSEHSVLLLPWGSLVQNSLGHIGKQVCHWSVLVSQGSDSASALKYCLKDKQLTD